MTSRVALLSWLRTCVGFGLFLALLGPGCTRYGFGVAGDAASPAGDARAVTDGGAIGDGGQSARDTGEDSLDALAVDDLSLTDSSGECSGLDSAGIGAYDNFRRRISIEADKIGVDSVGTLPGTGFPLLVELEGDWLKTVAVSPTSGCIENADGRDISFRADDGVTPLPHEIEHYDGIVGELVAWVRVSSLSKSEDTDLFIYYGNRCVVTPQQTPREVWDDEYVGVWHLGDETANGGVVLGAHHDSTANGNHGTQQANGSVDGQVGGAQDFEGATREEFIEIPDSLSLTNVQEGDYTIEAWFKPRTVPPGTGSDNRSEFAVVMKAGFNLGLYFDNSASFAMVHYLAGDDRQTAHGVPTSIGSFHHVSGVVSKADGYVAIYVDGNLEQQVNFAPGTAADEYDDTTWTFGAADPGAAEWAAIADGAVDEVRISRVARSADWIRTAYNNQSDPSSLYSLGGEEVLSTDSDR